MTVQVTVYKSIVAFIAFLILSLPASAQQKKPETLDVYLDCNGSCDFDFIRRQIPYVNYVRDRVGADVHVLITNESTGSGGRNYNLEFIGLESLAHMKDALKFTSGSTATDSERREGLTDTIARGLVRFLMTTAVGDRIVVSVPVIGESADPSNVQIIEDPWNFWVFNIRVSGNYEAEDSQSDSRIETRVSADRVTEDWKFGISGRMNYRESRYDLSTGSIKSSNRDGNIFGQLVKSLNSHWSAGLTTYTSTSSSNNTELSASISPTVEFSFFPYSESSTKNLRLIYEMNFRNIKYEEVTVYNKTEQVVVQNQLRLSTNFRQPWGNARAHVSLESYVTDFEETLFDLYNVSFGADMDIRVAKGLSLNFGVDISSVHDQIWLPLEDANDEDVLLGNRRLPTSFEYELDFGFSYRFGSIYNNVVNSRFNMN